MSFLNKIKGWGQRDDAPGPDGAMAVEGPGDAYNRAVAEPEPTVAGDDRVDVVGAAAFDSPANDPILPHDGSIISEAAPSEMTDFTETRQQEAESQLEAAGSGLPLVGGWPVAQQQRLLFLLAAVGLIGLVIVTALSLNGASKGAAQVGASGQALMQSQRLAKSVSQALIGSAQAFPEVRESVDVLARNVRGLKTGDGALPIAPGAVQPWLDIVSPLVDRAEKNATPCWPSKRS